ncbi:LysR substrate-binding domain-containing protein [Kineosporia mesophila]|uniref:LysR substrate-binding domain-containing protein n=1 Tax=Kineosporia mesophila TaxID=566012 RepID=A0ABP6Z736_9ACTN|nr:LysR substrate-binding domain-containing protein [Kineosporia mesophila]MCD5355205.1 LysR family transcriptional regulator [Kineosporia mesophila]
MELRLLRYFVAVCEERHFGRAASRLGMSQPPLSRAVQQLETQLGVRLLERSAGGVNLTRAGRVLYTEATALIEQAERARVRVVEAGQDVLTLGVLGGCIDATARMAELFTERHPGVTIRFRESGLNDPDAGLRSGLVDAAITRLPFDDQDVQTRVLRHDPVGALLRDNDPLAHGGPLSLRDLDARQWFRLPDGTDDAWSTYWHGLTPVGERPDSVVVRTANEYRQAVLWNSAVGLITRQAVLPDGLTWVELTDMPPSPLVLAWNPAHDSPLIRSLLESAVEATVSAADGER